MASVGHIAVGMAAARVDGGWRRPSVPLMVYWSIISILPDIDFIAFAFQVPYGAPFGHRGATHSFAFAAAVAVLMGLVARARGRPAARMAWTTAIVVATHPLLDAMTNYGLGSALFWPFDDTRYLLPWRIVPTLPTFEALWSLLAFRIAALELLLFSPFVVFALWPAPSRRPTESHTS